MALSKNLADLQFNNKLKVAKTLTINEHNWLVNLAIEYSNRSLNISDKLGDNLH